MVFKPSTLGNYPGNFDQVKDVCISQGSAVTFFSGSVDKCILVVSNICKIPSTRNYQYRLVFTELLQKQVKSVFSFLRQLTT